MAKKIAYIERIEREKARLRKEQADTHVGAPTRKQHGITTEGKVEKYKQAEEIKPYQSPKEKAEWKEFLKNKLEEEKRKRQEVKLLPKKQEQAKPAPPDRPEEDKKKLLKRLEEEKQKRKNKKILI